MMCAAQVQVSTGCHDALEGINSLHACFGGICCENSLMIPTPLAPKRPLESATMTTNKTRFCGLWIGLVLVSCDSQPKAAPVPAQHGSADSLQWDDDLAETPAAPAPPTRGSASASTRLPARRFAPDAVGVTSTGASATTSGAQAAAGTASNVQTGQQNQNMDEALPAPVPLTDSDATDDASALGRASTNDQDGDGEAWAIVLQTFSATDHAAQAQAALAGIVRRYPQLAKAYVRRVGGGSAVLIGTFTGPADPQAKPMLADVKRLTERNTRPFALAMLSRFDASPETMGQFDLRHVRERFPNQNPLYSVQVAVWSDLGSGELSLVHVKKAAEAYCRQLRTRGVEAYVFHDGGTKTSSVCVGVFGKDAYDPRSTLYSPEVEAVMRRFPKHLVNGEPLMLPYDKSDPTKLRAQVPTLVEVPR